MTVPLSAAVFQAAVEVIVPPETLSSVTSSVNSVALSSPATVTALSTYSPLQETGRRPLRSLPLSVLTLRPLMVTSAIS